MRRTTNKAATALAITTTVTTARESARRPQRLVRSSSSLPATTACAPVGCSSRPLRRSPRERCRAFQSSLRSLRMFAAAFTACSLVSTEQISLTFFRTSGNEYTLQVRTHRLTLLVFPSRLWRVFPSRPRVARVESRPLTSARRHQRDVRRRARVACAPRARGPRGARRRTAQRRCGRAPLRADVPPCAPTSSAGNLRFSEF